MLLLTYNKALMADLRRLLALVGVSDPEDARSVQVQSVHSFLGSVFRGLSLLAPGDDLIDHYSRLKGEALELLRAGALGTADIEKLFRERPESFGWDYLLIDEGQDWPEDERDLLRALYPASRFAVADGMDQFVRAEQPCDWRAGLSRSAVRVVSLSRCLRLKAVLARFANTLAAELGLAGWQVEENPEASGGRVVVTERGYFSERTLHDRLMAANVADGNQPVDTLVCVPPAGVIRENGQVRSTAGGLLEHWGHAVWDGVSTEVRDSYAHSVAQVRVVQYDSCRGLEGWAVVLLGLDELYRYKVASWKRPGGDYADDPLWPVPLGREFRCPVAGGGEVTELVLPGRAFWILVHDPDDESSPELATWGMPAPGQTFLLLCQEHHANQLRVLKELSLLNWEEVVPVGEDAKQWFEYRECQVESDRWRGVLQQPGCEELLEALRPVSRVNLVLEGGLRVPGQRVWLSSWWRRKLVTSSYSSQVRTNRTAVAAVPSFALMAASSSGGQQMISTSA